MDESAFDDLRARYVAGCARSGNSPLAPDELRALIAVPASQERDGLAGGAEG